MRKITLSAAIFSLCLGFSNASYATCSDLYIQKNFPEVTEGDIAWLMAYGTSREEILKCSRLKPIFVIVPSGKKIRSNWNGQWTNAGSQSICGTRQGTDILVTNYAIPGNGVAKAVCDRAVNQARRFN